MQRETYERVFRAVMALGITVTAVLYAISLVFTVQTLPSVINVTETEPCSHRVAVLAKMSPFSTIIAITLAVFILVAVEPMYTRYAGKIPKNRDEQQRKLWASMIILVTLGLGAFPLILGEIMYTITIGTPVIPYGSITAKISVVIMILVIIDVLANGILIPAIEERKTVKQR